MDLKSSSKKAKNIRGSPIKPAKISHFVLKNTYSAPAATARPIITPKRLDAVRPSPRKAATPSSAPAAAGRSPKSKRIGILSRRRVSSSPFTRVDPPSVGLSRGMPFSIDAALSGTVSSYKAESVRATTISTLEDSAPDGWMFDIHEDTPEEETGNVMSFSFQTVDISDDESRRAFNDDRGKENIPPTDYPSSIAATQLVTAARSISRQDVMTDEPRTPLGDLVATDFYADGCDASTYIIIPAEKSHEKTEKHDECPTKKCLSMASSGMFGTPYSQDDRKDFLVQADVIQKSTLATPILSTPVGLEECSADIEIWESESAKDDDEKTPEHTFQTPLEHTRSGNVNSEGLDGGNEAGNYLSGF